jgi:hypothetical protein
MWLLHGTTRFRAERIQAVGPDVTFEEPGSSGPAENFTFCISGDVSALGQAETYAMLKDRAFPNEGGAAILAVDVPEGIVEAAARELGDEIRAALSRFGLEEADGGWREFCGGVAQFDPGPALEALLVAWQELPKEIRGVS